MWSEVLAFVQRHSEAITIFLIALAVTMRKRLPPPLDRIEFLEWWYEWVRDALLTFISLRGPAHTEVEAQRQTERKVEADGTITTTTESSASLSSKDVK